MWLTWLTADVPPGAMESLGPFAVAILIAMGAIAWLQKELFRTRERLEKVEDERLALAERTLPVLQASSAALERASALLTEHEIRLKMQRTAQRGEDQDTS